MKYLGLVVLSISVLTNPLFAEETEGTIGNAKILNAKKSGRIILGKLASPLTIKVNGKKLSLKVGKWISYYDDNKYIVAASLAKAVKMKIGMRTLSFDRGASLRFAYRQSGDANIHYVQYAELKNRSRVKVDNLKIVIKKRGRRKSKGGVVKFDQNGQIENITTSTAKRYRIGTYRIKLPKFTIISFKNEKIASVRSDHRSYILIKLARKRYRAQSIIFDENKKVKQLRVKKAISVKVNGKQKKVRKGGTVYFNKSGKVSKVR
jgi:hypothetical protein